MSENNYFYKALCVRVVDGDTIDVVIDLGFDISRKERIRLVGIDTPESHTENLLEKKAGLAAKEYLRNLIEGKDIYISTIKLDKDKYCRYDAYIYAQPNDNNPSFNEILVNEGYARNYDGSERVPWDENILNSIINK